MSVPMSAATPTGGTSAVTGPDPELAEAREQLGATNEILAVLARSSGDPEAVFDAIVDNARRLCRAQVAQIHLVEEDRCTIARSVGLTPQFRQFIEQHPIRRDRSTLVGRVSLDRQTLQIADVLADPDYGRQDIQRLVGFRSILGAPMLVDDEVVGTLSVWRTSVETFDERVVALLTTFAAQAALAVRNVQLMRDLARKVDQLEALAEVGRAVSSSLDIDEVLATIIRHAVELSGTDGGSLMEFDEQTELFGVRTAYGTSPDVLEALRATRIHRAETLVGRAATARSVMQVPDLADVALDPHLRVLAEAGWRSLLAIPMLRADRVVGAFVVRRKRPGGFSQDTCDVLSAFASQSAVAIHNARLHQQLGRQGIELAHASRLKSEFLASMSHELRTPLNAVIGFSEVLLERMFGDLNDRQEEYLNDILGSGRHLLALLNDVLDLSKVEAGRMELEPTTLRVRETLLDSLAMVRERSTRHEITMHLDVADGVDVIVADELRVKQVMLNLLSNAVKFTPDGGRVDVSAWVDGPDLVITVADDGIGIAEADQERIFDAFQQGTRAAPQTEGTGLGLTLTRRIVELHGGRIWVSSAPGRGSTFGVALPRHGVVTGAGSDRWAGEDADGGGPLVVVVEDDTNAGELLRLHLRAGGLHPVLTRTGEEGLALVRTARPAAVVLDIQLPGMDGWQVLEAMQADAATQDIPVVVVSVLADRGRGLSLGAADYLVKPVPRARLLHAFERLDLLPAPRGETR
jgi:signal transduction histidine kinase